MYCVGEEAIKAFSKSIGKRYSLCKQKIMTLQHKIKDSAATVYGCGRANTKLRKSSADDIPYLDLASVGNKSSVGPEKNFMIVFSFHSMAEGCMSI